MAADIESRRLTRAAGFILWTAAVIGAIVGLLLLTSPGTLGLAAGIGGPLGGLVLVFSVIEAIAGTRAYQGRNFYGTLAGAVLGVLSIVTLPLDLIATIMIVLGEGEFEN